MDYGTCPLLLVHALTQQLLNNPLNKYLTIHLTIHLTIRFVWGKDFVGRTTRLPKKENLYNLVYFRMLVRIRAGNQLLSGLLNGLLSGLL